MIQNGARLKTVKVVFIIVLLVILFAIDISLCKSNPCLNGGKCTDVGDAKFECNCTGTFKGATCNIPMD